jgi:hydrogenase-4 component B
MTYVLISGIVLILGAVLALALRRNHQRAFAALITQAVASVLTTVTVAPILLHGGRMAAEWPWSFPVETIRIHVDPLSAFFLVWSLPMTFLGTLYALGYLRPYFDAGRNGGPHFALLNLVSLSFIMVYTVQNALVFLLGWEIAAVCAWLLVIWDYRSQKIRFAGFNYLVSTHVGLFVLVAAFMLMHSRTASMDFSSFHQFLTQPGRPRSVAFVLLCASFALKSAFFPFHTWLPRAHSAAPAHVSALMSGVIHKAGLFGFLRFTLFLGKPEEWMGFALLAAGGLSALFGVLYTAAQRDLKRLLGYSSTENVGIAAIGFGIGYLGLAWDRPSLVLLGFAGGVIHILNHALFKCLLFYAAGAIYRVVHSVDLERLGGLARTMPWSAGFFLLGGLAISALPPLNGFVGEWIIYAGLLARAAPTSIGNIALVVMAALLAFVGAVSALSITRAFGLAFLGSPRDPGVHARHDAPPTMLVPMVVHALGTVALGLYPPAAVALVRTTTALFHPGSDAELTRLLAPFTYVSWLLAATLLLAGVAAYFSTRHARRHVTWGCGYTAATPRMQYSGSSFSAQLTGLFDAFLPQLRREKLPHTTFPLEHGHLHTHHVDAVERRMFEVLGEGEGYIAQASEKIPERSARFAFAAGLAVILVVVALIVGGGSP